MTIFGSFVKPTRYIAIRKIPSYCFCNNTILVMKIKQRIVTLLTIMLMFGCSNEHKLKTFYPKEGKIIKEDINIDKLLENGTIKNQYIDTVFYSILDSLSFENNNPNDEVYYRRPIKLDYNKLIVKYSPEYYALYVSHHITKAIKYYDELFDGKIDFNSQKSYKSIEVSFGDVPLLTTPKDYIIKEKSNVSPSLFYHEIGHRAFWLIEDKLGIKFNGLSIIHMGLLEYFTVSLNNSPFVGEGVFPKNLMRNASITCNYPLDKTYMLDFTFGLLKDSYTKEIMNPNSNLAKYYNACKIHYSDILNSRVDNHRGGMVLTSTLWRIRQQVGQEKTDKLIAETILNLNQYMSKRDEFYSSDEDLVEKIWWYDVYYGLLDKDKELNNGINSSIIKKEFMQSGYPVERVQYI